MISNCNTLAVEKARCDDCISLLKMTIQMKENEVVQENIFKKGTKLLFEWLKSMQFKMEMIQEAKEGLKEIGEKVKKTQDRAFKLM